MLKIETTYPCKLKQERKIKMKREIYAEIRKSPVSNYLSIEKKFLKEDLKNEYRIEKNILIDWGHKDKIRKIEDFEKDFLLINVEYDGRKKAITDEDIFKTMHKNELVERKGESMFGGFYLATDKLNSQYIIKNAR